SGELAAHELDVGASAAALHVADGQVADVGVERPARPSSLAGVVGGGRDLGRAELRADPEDREQARHVELQSAQLERLELARPYARELDPSWAGEREAIDGDAVP